MLSRKENSAAQRLIRLKDPSLFTQVMEQVSKIRSNLDISKVREIKQAYDLAGLNDSRIFMAVVFRFFHPAMYKDDNDELTLKQGLCKAVADEIGMKESNCSVLFKQVRTWLRINYDNFKTETEKAAKQIEMNLIKLSSTPTLFA